MATKTSSSRTNNAVLRKNSRYVQGGTTDRYPKRLGWWERRTIPVSDDDIRFTITPREAGRPDLIAYKMYSDANLAWIVLQYNNIVDTNTELLAGMTIRLPTAQRVQLNLLNRPTGGKTVT